MSYFRDLDEYRGEELRRELARREKLRTNGKCDYCERNAFSEPPCKFPERHYRREA